ncbi:MAG: DUF4167 domain-containing protein [Pseudooceanicola sp.]
MSSARRSVYSGPVNAADAIAAVPRDSKPDKVVDRSKDAHEALRGPNDSNETAGWITGHMRSSKSRSRKSNRNRSVGNIVNRVFDSSGPEGKVRGTPQQIIDKYNQLARDAQLSGDRVATENFQQHAEHYLRMLAEAQREQDQKREQQEQENRQRQADRDRERAQRQEQESNGGNGGNGGGNRGGNGNGNGQGQDHQAEQPAAEKPRDNGGNSGGNDVLDVVSSQGEGEPDSGLVETPEDKPAKRSPARKPRKSQAKKKSDDTAPPDENTSTAAE